MKREIALIVFLSLVVAALASASSGGWSHTGRSATGVSGTGWSGGLTRYSRTVDRSFELAPNAPLEIHASSFDVSLVRGSGTALRFRGTIRGSSRALVDAIRVTMQQSGNRRILSIEAPENGVGDVLHLGFLHFFDAHFTIEVPPVAALSVVTTSGDVAAADQSAPLDVQTSSGDVTIDRTRAALSIRTSSGDVIVRQAAGVVQTQTNSGDVHVNDLGGSLSSTSTSGDLTASLASNWSGSSLAMHSSSGDIDLGLPRGFHGALHAVTASGDVRNVANLRATLAGATPVDLTSSSGNIIVH